MSLKFNLQILKVQKIWHFSSRGHFEDLRTNKAEIWGSAVSRVLPESAMDFLEYNDVSAEYRGGMQGERRQLKKILKRSMPAFDKLHIFNVLYSYLWPLEN